jgi:DNA polymerase-1
LETILFDDLKLPVVKRTKTSRSTDAEVLEELSDKHPLPAKILEVRSLVKLQGTYLEALPLLVGRDGRIHTSYHQAVAATGRISSSDPNLQNIPIRTAVGREIRAAFVAPPGHEILSADYSQIELRVLAHLSHDPILVDAFQRGEDVHARTAMEVFKVPRDQVTRDMRARAKTVNFAVIYGQGEGSLSKQLGISREEAGKFITHYFETFATLRKYMDSVVEKARAGEGVRTLLGRRRFLPDLHSSNRALRLAAERMATNTPIQGTSADIIKLAMIAVDRRLRQMRARARMLLTVHDELVFEVPSEEREAVGAAVRETMEGVMTLDVPLVVECGWGADWGAAH